MRPKRKAAQTSGGVICGKVRDEKGFELDGAERMPNALPLTGAGNSQKSRPEMSSPKAPRATLLGFPWKPANVYLPRSTLHPWRCIHNGTKVASRWHPRAVP